jgi:uncharacterized SAM-binding protein YcdF (DUF218 family)
LWQFGWSGVMWQADVVSLGCDREPSLTSGILDHMAGKEMFRQRFRSGWLRVAVAAILAFFLAFCGLSAWLFIFPSMGMPTGVNAIVVLGGSGDRLDLGMRLARDGKAPYLVLSLGLPWVPPGICTQHVGPAKVICFHPEPDTTQGEARGASKIAKEHSWTSIVLVSTRDQVWRAHLRFERCYAGRIYSVGSSIPWYDWPHAIVYQWAGTVKAEISQRSC